ncbi:unnamed protein product [Cylicocyclus nassatus]|uniref:Apple domain-containing protein n=1 Tax=Cylicocyclus nassatus TaxID=53992 RepID=A0AA36GL37_CYLNA|nr:unnamed protein product [Cylicocyclus nassatus]
MGTHQNLEQMMIANPLLRNLAMFSSKTLKAGIEEKGGGNERKFPLKIFSKKFPRKQSRAFDNNFDEDYVRLNETYFQDVDMTDNDIRRRPAERPTLAVEMPEPTISFQEEEHPFTATESIFSISESGQAVAMPVRISQTDDDDLTSPSPPINLNRRNEVARSQPALEDINYHRSSAPSAENGRPVLSKIQTKKKNATVYGLNKSKFQGYFYMEEIEDLHSTELLDERGPVKVKESELRRSAETERNPNRPEIRTDEAVVLPRQQGNGYVVSGTRYYVDNRIDGDVRAHGDMMVDDYKLKEKSSEFSEMMKDPLFAVEVELSRMKKRRRKTLAQKGVKTHYKNPEKFPLFDPEPNSTVSMMHKGGKVFERRSTNIGGKMITVELGNKNLQGVDLIVRPGSVVHDSIPQSGEIVSQKEQNIQQGVLMDSDASSVGKVATLSNGVTTFERPTVLSTETLMQDTQQDTCFYMQPDALITGLSPINSAVGLSELECLALCAQTSKCGSVNYASTVSSCEIFDRSEGPNNIVKNLLGYFHYIPRHKDLKSCMSDILSSSKGDSLNEMDSPLRCAGVGLCSIVPEMRVVESRLKLVYRRLFSSRAKCSSDSAVLFVRTLHSHSDVDNVKDVVFTINEDDCVFACLRNKVLDSRPMHCASAEYDIYNQRCTLHSKPRKTELIPRTNTTFYEKICVSMAVSAQCSGAAVDRRANMVMVGTLRSTATTANPEECIEKCVTAEKELGFQCLSVMFYYDETLLNCILNDASAKTNPASLAEEDKSIVDYFGVDDCYGMPEAADTRQTFLRSFPLGLEADARGEQAPPSGALIEMLRRS